MVSLSFEEENGYDSLCLGEKRKKNFSLKEKKTELSFTGAVKKKLRS